MVHGDDLDPGVSVPEWLHRLAVVGEFAPLLQVSWDEQLRRGYGHTLREIGQQPVTWGETAAGMGARDPDLRALLESAGVATGEGALVLTGSGSSLYVGECLAPPLQERLRVPARAIAAGQILTHPAASVPPRGPYLVVSIARSGNSPESHAVVDSLLHEKRAHHLVLTCNRNGSLATQYGTAARLHTIVLDDKTNDQSLVMTSSFTNLVLAGRFLARPAVPPVAALSRAAARILREDVGRLAAIARGGFTSAVFLGSGCRLGAAHEASLKMVEMTGGRVTTLPESYLGLRHGPMSALREDTLVVAFLSSDPIVRAYEADLIREIDRKKLGARRVIVGAGVPPDLAPSPEDVIVESGTTAALEDADLCLLDVLVGQVLAFFRCLQGGLHPDSPSSEGVINRVVSGFEIHRRPS